MLLHVELKLFFKKIVGWKIIKIWCIYISILSSKKGLNMTIIMKKVEKILMSVGGFLGKFYFLTSVT